MISILLEVKYKRKGQLRKNLYIKDPKVRRDASIEYLRNKMGLPKIDLGLPYVGPGGKKGPKYIPARGPTSRTEGNPDNIKAHLYRKDK